MSESAVKSNKSVVRFFVFANTVMLAAYAVIMLILVGKSLKEGMQGYFKHYLESQKETVQSEIDYLEQTTQPSAEYIAAQFERILEEGNSTLSGNDLVQEGGDAYNLLCNIADNALSYFEISEVCLLDKDGRDVLGSKYGNISGLDIAAEPLNGEALSDIMADEDGRVLHSLAFLCGRRGRRWAL